MQTDLTVPALFAFCILNFAFREAGVVSHRISLWGPVAAYMAVIFFVSSLHQPPLPPGLSDKPAHAFGYTGLGFVIARALAGGLPPRITRRDFFIGLAIAVAYAASDEFHQRFVPGRSAELADLTADVLGSAFALSVCWAWGIISPRSRQPAARSQQ